MSAFTYDSLNVLFAKYINKFGVDEDTVSFRRNSRGPLLFVLPQHLLSVNDVFSMISSANVWCPTGTIDSTRIIWSQDTMDEIDAVFNGSRCGTILKNVTFYTRDTYSVASISTQSDPVFIGRTLVLSADIQASSINAITFPESLYGATVEAYYSASFSRSPAPTLAWTDVRLLESVIDGSGNTSFNTIPNIILLNISNVSAYTITAKWRVVRYT